MHRHHTPLTALLVGALVLAGCGDTPPETDGANVRIDELEQELEQERSRTSDLQEQAAALEEELQTIRDTGDAQDDPGGEDPQDDDATGTPDGLTVIADPRTPEGLVDQLRIHLLEVQQDTGLPPEWEPATTAWVPYEVPDAVAGTYETPGDVVAALARAADAQLLGRDQWETTIRVLMDEDDPDLAYGAVLSWGFLDDAVRGQDVRITLTRSAAGQWEPGGAEQRFHCLRGLADEERCV